MSMPKHEPDKRSVKTIIEYMSPDKQYITVNEDLHKILYKETSEKGENFIPKPYLEAQRGYGWKPELAGNLILSLLISDDSIAELQFFRYDDCSIERQTIDGGQRLISLYLIIKNRIPIKIGENVLNSFEIKGEKHSVSELDGKYFNELPQLWQDTILDRNLRFDFVSNCSDDEAEKMYLDHNVNMKSLKPAEIRKAIWGKENRKILNDFRKANWLIHSMTQDAIDGNTGEEAFSKLITLLDNNLNPVSLSSKIINKIVCKYRDSGLPEDMIKKIYNMNSYLNNVIKIMINEMRIQNEVDNKDKGIKLKNFDNKRFEFLDKTNTIMFMVASLLAIEHNISEEDFADWSLSFFSLPTSEYINASGRDTSKRKAADEDAVKDRIRLIYASLTSKFGTAEIISNNEESTNNNSNNDDDEDVKYPETKFVHNGHLISEETESEIKSLMDEFSDPFEDDTEDEELEEAS